VATVLTTAVLQAVSLAAGFPPPSPIELGGRMAISFGMLALSNDATGSPESLVLAAYHSWVLDEDLATIRARSRLTGEIIVGGDGVISALPPAG